MAENSAIEWTDHTFNPWEGCQKVGPGCDHCYAETRNARFGGGKAPNWGPGAPRRRTSEANWRKPLGWQRDAARFLAEHGRRQRVFCASLADVFDNAVHPDWRSDLFEMIDRTPDLDWLLLTKRIGNVERMLWDDAERRAMPFNVWLGATVVNQAEADRDIPKLLAVSARVRFLSMEPLLGPVELVLYDEARAVLTEALTGDWQDSTYPRGDGLVGIDSTYGSGPSLDWVIVGGESGPGARPMHPDWARSLRDQCVEAGVPFLFKQWGEWLPWEPDVLPYFQSQAGVLMDRHALPDFNDADLRGWTDSLMYEGDDIAVHQRVGKKAAGRLLDGVRHDGVPV